MKKSYEANVQLKITRTILIKAENLAVAKVEALKMALGTTEIYTLESATLVEANSADLIEIKELETA
jgi:hypothetical protein